MSKNTPAFDSKKNIEKKDLIGFLESYASIFNYLPRIVDDTESVNHRDLTTPILDTNKLFKMFQNKVKERYGFEIDNSLKKYFANIAISAFNLKRDTKYNEITNYMLNALQEAQNLKSAEPIKSNTQAIYYLEISAEVSSALSRLIILYDFGMQPQKILNDLVKNVMTVSNKITQQLFNKSRTARDRKVLLKIVTSNLIKIMESCYEKEARNFILTTKNSDELEKRKYLIENSPIEQINKSFKEWSIYWSASALLYAEELSPRGRK